MKSALTRLRPLRYFLTLCLCALMMFSYAVPAFAAPMRNEPNADANSAAKKYEQTARDALNTDGGPMSLKETQERASEGGVNEVQGKAGIENMSRPSNAGGTPSVEKDVKNVLEKVQDKIGIGDK